ncbi:hypothetical protein RZV19_18820 [Burkholderia pseudomallei]|uniref:hypothetical protein n=1 Tax=Burkholderia pseudomallei TaxID=28450 RepID=UPI0029336407|nr:hypothetical protein [Burkholderia pseudomallei]MDV2187023.1 hypothetical protein [Burkholderia pseudomallei]
MVDVDGRWSMVDGRKVERSKGRKVERSNGRTPAHRYRLAARATATRRCSTKFVPMKILVATLLAVFVCAGCASGGAGGSGAGTGRIEMYGTIDQGVTIRN